MIDWKIVSREQVQKLNAVADFELRSFGAFYNELDHLKTRSTNSMQEQVENHPAPDFCSCS